MATLLAGALLCLSAACQASALGCPPGQVPWPSSEAPCQNASAATSEALAFMSANMPPWDVLLIGKLREGILGPTINLSLAARQKYAWAAKVPADIWRDWVLPYASVDESRSDWRPFMTSKLATWVQNATTLSEAALLLNKHLWTALRPQGAVLFRSGSTPMVYDPMSTLVFGYASCTGVSILYVDALRSMGIPARLVGTPAWHGKPEDGNHNWVEIWTGEGDHGWAFIEGSPAGAGESLTNPCDKWFCNPSHMDGRTKVFASRFDRHANTSIYPMAWDTANRDIPGVDRSLFYTDACSSCAQGKVANSNFYT